MADPQHPAVPFEQAVDLLTGEPSQLKPQHPDIAALAERLDVLASDPYRHYQFDLATVIRDAAAALRTLARPVEDEDEEAAKWLRRFNAYGGEFEEAASLLASLAREKASAERRIDEFDCCMCGSPMSAHDMGSGHAPVSMYDYRLSQADARATRAEQEIARLRKFLRTALAVVDESGNATADQIGILQEADRALAAAAGAEEPRSAVPGAPSPRWRQISPETEAGLKALDEATRLGPHRARKMPPTGEEEPR